MTGAPASPPPGVLRAVLANAGLRRIEAAWTLGIAGDAAFTVAILVAAFQLGGAVAVGILSIVRMAPSIVGAPLAGLIAGRRPPGRLLFLAHGLRAAGGIVTAVALALGLHPLVGLLGATLASSAGAFVRPLQVAATPSLATSPDELVAANSVTSTGEGFGAFVGPIVGGLLVAQGGPVPAAAAASLLFAIAAATLFGLRPTADEQARAMHEAAARGAAGTGSATGAAGAASAPAITLSTVARELTAGIRVLARRRSAAQVMIGFAGQVFVRGLLTVLLVVAAIRVLGMGEPGVGTLAAAYGLGTLVGAGASVRLAGRRELAPTFAISLALWSAPLALIAAVPRPEVAIASLLVTGVANAILDVAGFTLLQRTVAGTERVAVFGLLEATASFGVGVGGLVAPILIGIAGDRGALLVTGAILPVLAVLIWPRLRAIDRDLVLPDRELALLRGISLFARLPLTALERLAEGMRPRTVAAGEVLMREGEPGDGYDVIEAGRFEVRSGGRVVSTVGPGDGVGEIALLRSGPRTATVTALTDGSVYVLDAAAFRAAVAGPTSAAAAAAVIDERLARSAAG